MSQSKKNFYRKVLKVERFNALLWEGHVVPSVKVIWCRVLSETSRTVKTNHVGVSVYVGGRKFKGVEARHPDVVSIKLKNSMSSKYMVEKQNWIDRDFKDALSAAARKYVMGQAEYSKGLSGVVVFFDKTSGEGMIKSILTGQIYHVFACNINGKKTWYPETACVYLVDGETVTFDLADMGDHLTAAVTQGGHFDAEKWASLDHDSLAFKCDKDGNAINGFFE